MFSLSCHFACFVQETSGFIVNRLLMPYIFEAIRMVERGSNID